MNLYERFITNNKLKNITIWLSFFILYSLAFLVFFKTLKLTLPFVISLLISYILYRPAKKLKEKFNSSSSLISIITIVIFYCIFLLIFTMICIGIGGQAKKLIESINISHISTIITPVNNYLYTIYKKIDPSTLNFITENTETIISGCTDYLTTFAKNILNSSISFVSNIPYLLTVIGFAIISNYFILKKFLDSDHSIDFNNSENKFLRLLVKSKDMLFKYCGSYVLILFMTFVELFLTLLILRIPYSLLISITCTILDILPIVGMAIILVPISIYYIYIGSYFTGIALLVAYGLICLIRQVIEPKIISTNLKISPLASIIAIFIGLNAYGLLGMLYCVFLVVFVNLFKDFLCEMKPNTNENNSPQEPVLNNI